MNDRLILLVGASGSGKTTIAKELESMDYNIIHSFTTRNPREKNEWGHTFLRDWFECRTDGVFTGMEKPTPEGDGRIEYIDIDEMIAYFNSYNTGHHYFATKEQYQGKGTSIYIVDPDGANQVRQNVNDAEVVTIFLMADEQTRWWRLFSTRERGTTEIRIKNDRKIFSKCKCDYVVDANREIDLVLLDILEIIEQGELQ